MSSAMLDSTSDPEPQTLGEWFAHLPPLWQLGYGCFGVVIVGTLVLYCSGLFSLLVRPALVQRAPTSTAIVIRPTLSPPPTLAQPTFIYLPPATLLATPTQAPIPTREPTATPTQTVDLTSLGTLTPGTPGTPRRTPSPTTRTSATSMPRPTPTATLRP